MASPEQLSLQIIAIDAALVVSRQQFADQTSGSAEQKQLAVAINELEQEKEFLQAQLSSFTTANVTASTTGAGVVPQTTVNGFGQVVAVDSPAAITEPTGGSPAEADPGPGVFEPRPVPQPTGGSPAEADPGAGSLSDEEILARQNPGGLSDEEILDRQAAAQNAAQKSASATKTTSDLKLNVFINWV